MGVYKAAASKKVKNAKIPQSQTASWLEIVWNAVHQLGVLHPNQEYFHYYQDICRYVEAQWHRLAEGKDRTHTWTNTVSSTITTHKRLFKPGPDQGYWGLRVHPEDPLTEDDYAVIMREWSSEADVEDAPVVTPVTQRRKRKTGWGEKKRSKKIKIEYDESDDEESEESESVEEEVVLAPRQRQPILQTIDTPLFNLLEPAAAKEENDEEDQYVDIMTVSDSEDDPLSDPLSADPLSEDPLSDSLDSIVVDHAIPLSPLDDLSWSSDWEDTSDAFYAALHQPLEMEERELWLETLAN